jgi:DNA-binding protein H-NS
MAKRTKTVLARLDFQGLLDLREEVNDALSGFRTTLEKQLEQLGASVASVVKRGRGSTKGRKVAPKYKGPGGETWAGRGATPRWLKAAMKEGKKAEEFLIDKAAGKAHKATKRRAKK